MKYLLSKDVASGGLFVLLGLTVIALSGDLDFGGVARPGNGFFPLILSILLVMTGLVMIITSLRCELKAVGYIAWRPLFFIASSVIVFSISIERVGLMPSVFVAVIVASFAQRSFGWASRILLAIGLSLISAILFGVLLQLPVPLW